ncbi:hypothetical protein TREMEDRAFT_59478 [Tremella mesenterica DSM 1558]|uniref:uncharacterized protein n=1 Tax=Tremella mesenterica (strain ATCC 24925 / CBS 8224 / DSM 1558 / NBRC 9311 / NRRL Y-6157 / RJB 2259-6 / UBC 559-6) TaxID=578456 RepID=UPI0003F499EC|nr:uncharacterized protein TREMEDRAFT_59478 [Tremella mesenterica DSM 1558]EIW73314.1 hypothetical protein TREMEDRAFT_59478 [Tremella mesenterica DSM 1558]
MPLSFGALTKVIGLSNYLSKKKEQEPVCQPCLRAMNSMLIPAQPPLKRIYLAFDGFSVTFRGDLVKQGASGAKTVLETISTVMTALFPFLEKLGPGSQMLVRDDWKWVTGRSSPSTTVKQIIQEKIPDLSPGQRLPEMDAVFQFFLLTSARLAFQSERCHIMKYESGLTVKSDEAAFSPFISGLAENLEDSTILRKFRLLYVEGLIDISANVDKNVVIVTGRPNSELGGGLGITVIELLGLFEEARRGGPS